jgi:TolB-like protein/Flp pilus assembly protein TadD
MFLIDPHNNRGELASCRECASAGAAAVVPEHGPVGVTFDTMRQHEPAPPLAKDSSKPVLEQLDRILNSSTFREAGRLKRFIKFIVSEAVAGRADELKEYVVGVQVFDKEPSFDPRTDPIVRVQARRLRAMLDRYYREEGVHDELVIELPKGGYGPVFRARQTPEKRSAAVMLISRNTVAVSQFSDYSPGGNLQYFCEGLRQEIISALSKLSNIRILADAPNASGNSRPANLQAAILIGGSVRKSGDDLRITAQIVDGASGCYLWSETIDGQLQETFRTQSAVAQALAQQLQTAFAGGRSNRARPTVNLAARNLFMQGRHHMDQRTEEGLRKAVDFFERAIAEDPQYALAHSGLADAYILLGHYGVLAPAEVWTKSASSAASAVMLDEMSAEAHTSLAHVKATQDWDWALAEAEFRQAIRLDPTYATAHHWYAMTLLAPFGRLDEALEEILTAQSLNPVSAIIARDVAVIYYYRRDFGAALDQCDHTISLNPHFSAAFWTLGLIQEQRRDYEEAAAAFQRAIHLSPESPRMQGALGRLYAISGRRRQSLEILKDLQSRAATRYVSPFELGLIHFALGHTEEAFGYFDKAFHDRCFELLAINVDPRFDILREDPRFVAIASRLGLSPVETHSRTEG